MSEGKEVFLRKTSGLVRKVSTLDCLIYNIFEISIGGALTSLYLILLATCPGTDAALSYFLWTYLFVIPGICWGMMATIFPRSGGDYIYNTRILSPFLGFIISWMNFFWVLFFLAFFAYWTSITGVSCTLFTLGVVMNNEWLLNASTFFLTANGIFITGLIVIIVVALLAIIPPAVYFKIQKILFIIAIAGIIVAFIAFAMTTQSQFIERFNALLEPYAGPDYYNQLLSYAPQAGWEKPPWSWNSIWWSLNLVAMANMIIWFSSYIGGEIKHVEKAQMISIPGAAVFVGTFTGLGCWLITRMVGFDFLNAVAYLGFVVGELPQGIPVDVFFYPFLASVTFQNPAIVTLLGVSNIIWQMSYMPMLIQCMPRYLLAWSMDRLIPGWFGAVNRKFYTPHNAVLTCFIIALIFFILYTYTTLLTYASGLFFLSFTTLMVSIAAIILPWKLPEVFKASPLGKYKICLLYTSPSPRD